MSPKGQCVKDSVPCLEVLKLLERVGGIKSSDIRKHVIKRVSSWGHTLFFCSFVPFHDVKRFDAPHASHPKYFLALFVKPSKAIQSCMGTDITKDHKANLSLTALLQHEKSTNTLLAGLPAPEICHFKHEETKF